MLRVVRPCPRLPREVGDAPSLEPFQARLDGGSEHPELVGDVPAGLDGLEMSLPTQTSL